MKAASCRDSTELVEVRAPQRGAALVIVLLLLAVLSVLLAEFVYEQSIDTTLLKNHEAKVQARYVARAGQNAARGLMARAAPDSNTFNNEVVQLFRYSCISTISTLGLGMTSEQEQQQEEALTDMSSMEGCGTWSLSIPYTIADTPLDLEIYDEQARLNLNALFTRVPAKANEPTTGEDSLQTNTMMLDVIFELFRYQALRHNILISDADLMQMLKIDLMDYIDHDTVDGSLDKDSYSYFEYEDDDSIIPLKNGWLDTVDEIRYLPGMSDDLFDAVKDFLTVYPVDNIGAYSAQVNLNAASFEVVYALIRGTSYQDDEATITEEKALELANQTILGAAPSSSQAPDSKPLPAQPAANVTRQLPAEAAGNALLDKMLLKPTSKEGAGQPRFWRVKSTALTDNGLQTAITEVVKVDKMNRIQVLYYNEE
jgi:type II secretory pathway component PulK